MYFPIGWPINLKLLPPDAQQATINHVSCDAVRILIAACSDSILGIWYANPLIPITFYTRTEESISTLGVNKSIIWKPDSRQLLILTSHGNLILYYVNYEEHVGGVMAQKDPPMTSLKRDSAELFIKENVPRLSLQEVGYITMGSAINTVNCISLTELLIALEQSLLLRVVWADLEENAREMEKEFSLLSDCVINVKSIPLYANHQCHVKRLPALVEYAPVIACLEYSPFIGGCAVVFSNRRAAFLIAKHLRFEEQNMHGYWVPELDDATVCSVNHKFRLLAYGRQNSEVCVFGIEDGTGDLEFSHRLVYEHNNSMQDMLGDVCELRWSPDGCVIVVAWQRGGISLWSTFGSLLMCSLNWDFGLHVDLQHFNPIQVAKLEWSTEGYQLFMTCRVSQADDAQEDNADCQLLNSNVLQLNFVKSSLSMNPCMASHTHLLLQGDDTLYLNQGHSLEKMYFEAAYKFPNNQTTLDCNAFVEDTNFEYEKASTYASVLTESKHWSVIQLPLTYASTNWPIRYTSVDEAGLHIAVAGRTGLAHYSILTKKWKLFGNETQEKDFVVSGGLLWWQGFIVMGCYSILDRTDEIRYYREDTKLDNQFGNKILVRGPVITLNIFHEQLIILTGDGIVSLFVLQKLNASDLSVQVAYEIDVKSICIHPACIVALQITNLKHEQTSKTTAAAAAASHSSTETIILNVCGRLLMFQRDSSNNFNNCIMTSCLASCVESFWLASEYEKGPMSDCLWLYCGVYGMRLWLPVQPPASNEQMSNVTQHTFMSKRIMLSFPLKLYPLVILFDNVIVLGVENENTLFSSGSQKSHFSLPYNLLERKSQVYLHKILRQLIKRNLGYGAWKIAQSCRALPYFPHALELLLHEVLEEEATSKEPIPDALLPSILDFIREYPVYLQTIVQCARKTEMALWPYLFSMAGKPKDIFQLCVQSNELETAASYLIILQNFESAVISKQHATMLLDICLQKRKWRLAKDLHRFLKAIDPNDIESPRSSMIVNLKIAPQPASQAQAPAVNQSEVLNLILGPIGRERSFSTTTAVNLNQRKDNKKEKTTTETNAANAAAAAAAAASAGVPNEIQSRPKTERLLSRDHHEETFGINEMLHQHAQTLLRTYNVLDLGNMSAYLDFHLVKWLSQESERSARFDDYVEAIIKLHMQLALPEAFEKSLQHAAIDWLKLHDSYDNSSDNITQQPTDETSESGYYSHAIMDGMHYNGNFGDTHMQAINEDKEQQFTNTKYNYEAYPLNERLYRVQPDALGNVTKQIALPEKLALKIRYLLQLFIEANCIDFALVLSILLQDAASIARIINSITRSESADTTQRIEYSLKDFTQRCFECESGYTSFMISIQPYIYLLEQFRKSTSKKSSSLGDLTKSQQTHGSELDAKHAARIKKNSRAGLLRDTDAARKESLTLENVSNSLHHYHMETNNANAMDARNAQSNRCSVM